MQNKDDIFSKIVASKTIIIGAFVAFFIIYAVIGAIMALSTNDFLSVGKIMAPLSTIGFGLIIAVDSIHKMSSDKTIVKAFGSVTLLLGAVDLIMFILMVWGIIPMYEKTTSLLDYSYSFSFSFAFKLILSMTSIITFTFLGSIIMNIKENHGLIGILKKVSTGFLACASLIAIVCLFMDFSKDLIGIVRALLLLVISWITAIGLGAMAFYLSKTITWEEKSELEENSSRPASPSSSSPASELPSSSATKPFANLAPVTVEPEDAVPTTTPEPVSTTTPIAPEPVAPNPLSAQPSQSVQSNQSIQPGQSTPPVQPASTINRQSIYPETPDFLKHNKPEATNTGVNTPAP